MTSPDPAATLTRLLTAGEGEVVEFKEATDNFPTSDIGKYFSALANEANLRGEEAGWLVFGVTDRTHRVVGTDFRRDRVRLDALKMHVTQGAGASFRDIHEVDLPEGRVIMFEIPPAPRGIPIDWNGHYYARAGESLVALSDPKRDEIRNQTLDDWSAVVVAEATIDDLDPDALQRARRGFGERHTRISEAKIAAWDDATFLAKARLTRAGGITRAALLLLGTEQASDFLSPHPAEITWRLEGQEQAYEHFNTPFLLNATEVYRRIRNIQMRLMPPNELIYREISKYDERSILEALYNCIAHQDYRQRSRIIVTEFPDRVEFISVGEFYDGRPEDYAGGTATPRKYRNPFLVAAMSRLNLIDHMGYGIHRMITDQVRRFLPLPDYDLTREGEVRLTMPGAVIDKNYSRLLMSRTDVDFVDVLALDRVQKHLPISDDALKRLRRGKLVEGRRNQLRVSANVAAATDTRADYIRTRAQDDAHYRRLIIDFLKQYGSASRRDVDDLLLKYLDESLDAKQRHYKVSNVLSGMRRDQVIHNVGTRSKSRWELV